MARRFIALKARQATLLAPVLVAQVCTPPTREQEPKELLRSSMSFYGRPDSRELPTVHKPTTLVSKKDAFQYARLTSVSELSGGQIIRLLELLPGRDGEALQCVLKQTSLLETPDAAFEAISYCCGKDDETAVILCDGKRTTVPKSLARALRRVRYPDKPRVLWADAICIDQSNKTEKDEQIRLIWKIYAQAQGTLIWLGEEGDESDLQMSIPARMAIWLGLAVLRPRVDGHISPQVRFWDTREARSYEFSPFSYTFYLTLIKMLREPWFRRGWIVQEVAVSRKVTMMWGSAECDWNELILALEAMSQAKIPLAFMPTFQHIMAIENERKRYKEGTSTLLEILFRHQRCLTTLPVDKIYAFAGLVATHLNNRIDLPSAYQDEIPSVYRRVATKIVSHDRTLDILSHPPWETNEENSITAGLPSWVPHWNQCTSMDNVHTMGLGPLPLAGKGKLSEQGARQPRFKAAGDSKYSPEFSTSGEILIAEGFVFDTVAKVGPVFQGVELPQTATTLRGIVNGWLNTLWSFWKTRHVLRHWEELARVSLRSKDITRENISHVYRRTICTGEDSESGTSLLMNAIFNKAVPDLEAEERYALYRRLIKTDKGYIGLASCNTRAGDSVALCKGSRVPLVIREERDCKSWRLVGDTYIHGIMDGEAFEESKCRKIAFR